MGRLTLTASGWAAGHKVQDEGKNTYILLETSCRALWLCVVAAEFFFLSVRLLEFLVVGGDYDISYLCSRYLEIGVN